MAVRAVRWRRNRDRDDRDPDYCYTYERDSDLYHAHKNPSGWSERRFTLRTLDHHLTMYHKDTFYATLDNDLPDFILNRLDGGDDR